MIRVLQVGMTSNIGGIETYIIQQLKNIDKDIIQYDFVNTEDKQIAFYDEIYQYGGHVYNVTSRRENFIKHYYEMAKLIINLRKKYKAVTLNSLGLTYVYPLLIAFLAGIPIRVLHSHNGDYMQRQGIVRKILILVNKFIVNIAVNKKVACSHLAGDWMFGIDSNYSIVHNVIDISKFKYNEKTKMEVKKSIGLKSNEHVIANIGRFSYQKNQEFLISVMYEVVKKEHNSKLLLIGGWGGRDGGEVYEKVKKSIKKYNLENHVILLGMRNDIEKLSNIFDCFVLPSRFEGLPVTGIEMQAAGIPCIFSDTITKEIRIGKNVHFLSLNESYAEWADLILRCINEKRIDNKQLLIKSGYGKEASISEVCDLYELK